MVVVEETKAKCGAGEREREIVWGVGGENDMQDRRTHTPSS